MQEVAKCLHPPIQSRSCLFAIIKIYDSCPSSHLATQVKTLRISWYSLSDEYKFIWLMGYVLVTNWIKSWFAAYIQKGEDTKIQVCIWAHIHTYICTHTRARARIHTHKVKINKQQINEVHIGTSWTKQFVLTPIYLPIIQPVIYLFSHWPFETKNIHFEQHSNYSVFNFHLL